MIDPAARDRRLDELLRQHHGGQKNRVLVFVLYKKEAARVEAMLQRKSWNVRSLSYTPTTAIMLLTVQRPLLVMLPAALCLRQGPRQPACSSGSLLHDQGLCCGSSVLLMTVATARGRLACVCSRCLPGCDCLHACACGSVRQCTATSARRSARLRWTASRAARCRS